MLNDDLEIARKMLRGGWVPPRERRLPRSALGPASFREIDGSELARQYATHRRIEKTSSLGAPSRAGRFGSDEGQQRIGGRMLNWARELRARLGFD